MNDHFPADKTAIRTRMLAQRAQISLAEAQSAAQAVADFLLTIIPQNAIVAGYRAMRGELDVGAAMTQLSARGNSLCLPVVEASGAPLIFRAWKPGDALEKGQYGVEIPVAHAPIVPAIVLVPLVAFDRALHRLGYGGGYYDRTIESLRKSGNALQMIGVAYALQQVENVVPQPHDQKLDAVVTEKEIIRWMKKDERDEEG